jgi:hypothetical protein
MSAAKKAAIHPSNPDKRASSTNTSIGIIAPSQYGS